MQTGKLQVLTGAVLALSLGSWGCATKKHVREAIAPVQDQVNQVQKQGADNKTAIGDLDRQVATADEKASDAGKRAGQALDSANKANSAAQSAQQRADAANSLAQQANDATSKLDSKVDSRFANLDNYHLVNTQPVYFRTGRYVLDKQAQTDLDTAIQNITNSKDYVIEIEGFADRTGTRAFNEDLSRKRADAVVRYLTVDHNIPLRDIRELGVGSVFPNAVNKTRDDRKNNRRVDIKIYALDLTGTAPAQSASGTSNNGQADRMNQDQMPAQTQRPVRQQ